MKFGREFRIHLEQTLPEWRDKFLRYKLLKKLLNSIAPAAGYLPPRLPLPEFQVWFVAILTREIEKFNDFYVGKEEDLIIRFQALMETIERVQERDHVNDAMFTLDTGFEFMTEIHKDLVAIHGEMVLLKSYSSLNFAGLIKILKKYDKRTGAMLSMPFTQLAFHQPFFTIEPLTRLIHECEAKLEFLFPLEAEVVEPSTAVAEDHDNRPNASLDTTLLLVEETVDIYRSTLAAISTIEGLRRPSSTYNHLSMSYLFGRHDDDSGGDVTAENSPCNSFVKEEVENEEEDVCFPQ
ncbi:SPX domain-containing protein 4-like [Salvia miltiorrhiza]|uniref:SPX domain-containing protein 4-like n=1 Tax=Salvia miltiorrhiza TaxID=226208 RepID=UPI0025ACD163|nr:SPX domain-containing protein 4-like [Salvia miltiorrhiza]XP_057769542.1 SPX domain-containing protein 4-like [Salvia miltiorrhiza]